MRRPTPISLRSDSGIVLWNWIRRANVVAACQVVLCPWPDFCRLILHPGRSGLRSAPDQAGQRLDVFLAEAIPAFSRATLRRAIDAGHVQVDGAVSKPSLRLRPGSLVAVQQIDVPREGPAPQDIPLSILHEDDAIIVVDKPAGMIVHPAKGHWEGTLASALAHHFGTLSGRGGPTRPGIVHRLDRDTSGVIVVAKNDQVHDSLAAQFKARQVEKEYLAIVVGTPDRDCDVIDEPIGNHPTHREKKAIRRNDTNARPAVTQYDVVERFAGYALCACCQKQAVRTRFASIWPTLDFPCFAIGSMAAGRRLSELELIPRARATREARPRLTSPEPLLKRQALHAHRLTLTHPTSGQRLSFEANLPADMLQTLEALRRWRLLR